MARFLGWSMTKLEDHEMCPLLAKLKHLDSLCTNCWKGRLMGYDPKKCDTCGKEAVKPEAWARGTEIGEAVNKYLLGKRKAPPPEVRHEGTREFMKKLRGMVKKKEVFVEKSIVLDSKWKPVSQMTKDAWFRGKLDVLIKVVKETWAEVVDWKTGGIDKNTGAINMRKERKYDHQMGIYNTATLSAFPELQSVSAQLVFLDVGPRFSAKLAKPGLDVTRKTLAKHQKAWEQRVEPLLNDKTFSPRPGRYCDWCDYAKGRGGPCKFGG